MTRRTALQLLTAGTTATQALAEPTKSPARKADFQGIPVHYESYGNGHDALVFIHGWTCDLTFWRRQEPIYTKRRSILIDLPGHGQSGKPHIAYPMELFAQSVDAVMRDAEIGRAHV